MVASLAHTIDATITSVDHLSQVIQTNITALTKINTHQPLATTMATNLPDLCQKHCPINQLTTPVLSFHPQPLYPQLIPLTLVNSLALPRLVSCVLVTYQYLGHNYCPP